MRKWLAVLLVLCMAISLPACGSNGNTSGNASTAATQTNAPSTSSSSSSSEASDSSGTTDTGTAGETDDYFDPFGYYDETVHITQTRILATWMGFDEGENEDNNWWTRTYKEQLNIELTNLFTAPNWGPDFDAKINVAFATDDLPDVMPLYTTLAVKAIQGNKVLDLKEVFEKCASDQVKEIFATDERALQAWTIDGKLYGLSKPRAVDSWSYFWTPKSYLDELNGGVIPTTFEELEAYAMKVKEKTGGYAIGMENRLSMLGNLVYAFHGTNEWLDKGGQLVWGRVQPEAGAAWAKAADWYQKGILAQDFAGKSDEDLEADFLNGKVGIIVDGTNLPNGSKGRNWIKLHPDDDLVCIPIMAQDNKDIYMVKSGGYGEAIMVSAKCANPDAVMRLFNLSTAISNDHGKPDFITDTEYNTTKGGNMGWWNRMCTGGGYVEDVRPEYQPGTLAAEAIRSGSDGSELRNMHAFSAVENFDRITSWMNEGTNGSDWDLNWSLWNILIGTNSTGHSRTMHENGRFIPSPKWGPETEAEAEHNQNFDAKYIEYATMAIMNNNVDQQFTEWVNYFNNNGGQDINQQVNEWYSNNK